MFPARPLRLLSPELLFGLFHTLVWLALVVTLSAGVLGPLAQASARLAPLG